MRGPFDPLRTRVGDLARELNVQLVGSREWREDFQPDERSTVRGPSDPLRTRVGDLARELNVQLSEAASGD